MSGDDNSSSANGCQDFHNALNEFRHKDIFCDVTIYGDDDKAVHAHSIVLAAGSDVLKNTLTQREANRRMQKDGFVIKIEGISASVWKLLLDFLYLRRLSVQLSPAVLKDLFLAARILGIKNLVASLGSLIETMDLDVDTACRLEQVNVKLTRRIKQREQSVQVDEYEDDENDENISPPPKKFQRIPEGKNLDDYSQDDFDDEDEDYIPGSGGKRITKQIKKRLSNRRSYSKTPRGRSYGKGIDKDNLRCINVNCQRKFDTYAELANHHFACIMAPTAYKVQEYAYKDEDGRLIYSDPFQIDGDGLESPWATRIEEPGKRGQYQCGHCDQTDGGNKMIMHLAFVHGKRKPLHCKLCHNKYTDLRLFLDHYLSSHTPELYTCVHCFQRFDNRAKMKRHIVDIHINKGEPKHMCNGCGKMFFRAGHARRHETYHLPMEQRRVHACRECGKKFCSKADRAKHETIHIKEKSFSCNHCSYRSNRKSMVVLHERSHGIITANYMCITCGRYYLNEHAYKSHLETMGHEGKHVNDLTMEEHQRLLELQKANMYGVDFDELDAMDMSENYIDPQADIVNATEATAAMDATEAITSQEQQMSAEAITSEAGAITSVATGDAVTSEPMTSGTVRTEAVTGEDGQTYEIHYEVAAGEDGQIEGDAGGATLDRAQLEQLIASGAWEESADGQTVVYAVVDQ